MIQLTAIEAEDYLNDNKDNQVIDDWGSIISVSAEDGRFKSRGGGLSIWNQLNKLSIKTTYFIYTEPDKCAKQVMELPPRPTLLPGVNKIGIMRSDHRNQSTITHEGIYYVIFTDHYETLSGLEKDYFIVD